jgi:hypothetical protein
MSRRKTLPPRNVWTSQKSASTGTRLSAHRPLAGSNDDLALVGVDEVRRGHIDLVEAFEPVC